MAEESKFTLKMWGQLFMALYLLGSSLIFGPQALAQSSTLDSECEDYESIEECQKILALIDLYGQDYYYDWYHQALFNRDIFFRPYDGEDFNEDLAETPNMVDAAYRVALRAYSSGWAFAIDGHYLRMVRLKNDSEITDDEIARYNSLPEPMSLSDMAKQVSFVGKWEEADLRKCKGVVKQLKDFPSQSRKIPLWHSDVLDEMKGKKIDHPLEIIVTADGDGVNVRAQQKDSPSRSDTRSGRLFMTFYDSNGGYGYRWALKMYDIVEPCLEPASSKAPWEKIIEFYQNK